MNICREEVGEGGAVIDTTMDHIPVQAHGVLNGSRADAIQFSTCPAYTHDDIRSDAIQCSTCPACSHDDSRADAIQCPAYSYECIDEYDYEIPYWAPADRKAELLGQFKKLKIPSVVQQDLK